MTSVMLCHFVSMLTQVSPEHKAANRSRNLTCSASLCDDSGLVDPFEDYILLQIKVSGCGVRGHRVAGSQTFGWGREGLEESCERS